MDGDNDVMLEGNHWESHLVHLVELYLALMKASYSAIVMLECFVIYLELHMYPLMVLMMANLWVHFLVKCFDQTMELYLVVLLVVVTEIFTACVWEQHWEYHMNVPM